MKKESLVKILPTWTEPNKNSDSFSYGVLKSDIGIVLEKMKVKLSASSYWRVLRSDGTIYDYSHNSLRLINE